MEGAVVLAGSGGSHPATLTAIATGSKRLTPELRRVIFDLSAMDGRGIASYEHAPAKVCRFDPGDLGLRNVFKTAGPNLVIAGGARRFAAMIDHFERNLRTEQASILLTCHSWGFPEQALLHACERLRIPVVQLDEGPFSGAIRTANDPLPFSLKNLLRHRLLVRLGLLPHRDLSGSRISLFLSTSPARQRLMLSRGVQPERCALVSHPRFDQLPGVIEAWQQGRAGRAARDRSHILVFHQPFARDRKVAKREASRAEAALFKALALASTKRRLAVTVRMHPRSDPAEVRRYEQFLSRIDAPGEIQRSGALYDAIPHFDLFAGFYSSAMLEAAACGAPVVGSELAPAAFSNPTEGKKASALRHLGIAMGTVPDRIAELILDGLDGECVEPRPELFDEQLGLLSGHGAADVVEILVALATREAGDLPADPGDGA